MSIFLHEADSTFPTLPISTGGAVIQATVSGVMLMPGGMRHESMKHELIYACVFIQIDDTEMAISISKDGLLPRLPFPPGALLLPEAIRAIHNLVDKSKRTRAALIQAGRAG